MNDEKEDQDSDLAGFGVYQVRDKARATRQSFYIPFRLAQALDEEYLAAETARKAEELARNTTPENWLPNEPFRSRAAPGRGELDPVTELQALTDDAIGKEASTESFAVYDVQEPLKLIQDVKTRTPDREVHKRNEQLYKQLKAKGHLRALAKPKADLQELEQMRKAFPHFSPVLDLVWDQYAFAQLTDKPLEIPPILIGGDPGIGKTRFSQDLAKALGTVMRRLPFDNDQTGSILLGSAKNWANTQYGAVFDMVVLGEFANPVFLLDEIDKASHSKHGDPLASLHTLLEPVTAQRVCDVSLDFEFNASQVVWIATANHLHRIPQSLRSRFQEFWIEQPTGAQALQMAEVVAQEVHEEMNLPDFEPPAKEVVHLIAHLSAREQIQALKRAYAAAKVAGRLQVVVADLAEQVRQEANEVAAGEAPPTGWVH